MDWCSFRRIGFAHIKGSVYYQAFRGKMDKRTHLITKIIPNRLSWPYGGEYIDSNIMKTLNMLYRPSEAGAVLIIGGRTTNLKCVNESDDISTLCLFWRFYLWPHILLILLLSVTAQDEGADPSLCNSINMQTQPLQQNCFNFEPTQTF